MDNVTSLKVDILHACGMTRKGYGGISLPDDLVEEVDEVIRKGYRGYTSRAEFVKEAVRKLLDEVKRSEEAAASSLMHLNPENNYPAESVKIWDRALKRVAEIFFQEGKAFCTLCESYKCSHIRFMWGLPRVAEQLEKKGVKKPLW